MPGYLGLDPEFSAIRKSTGKAVSAHHIIGDETLQQWETSGDHGDFTGVRTSGEMNGAELSRDGAAFEVRSKVVSSCRDNIIPYVAEAMRMVQLRIDDDDIQLSSAPIYTLESDDGPDDIRTFGCAPDFNAYTLSTQVPALSAGDMRRYTGGHVHISYWPWAMGNKHDQAALTLLLDMYVGLPFVAMLGEHYAEGEAERREYYGKAGSFRYDHKGKLEYRTLSGRLLLSPLYLGWVLGQVRVIDRAFGGRPIGGFYDGGKLSQPVGDIVRGLGSKFNLDEIRRIINEHDVLAAETMYPALFEAMPNWSDDSSGLSNTDQGGGTASYDPFTFKTIVDAFVDANHQGIHFRDDMQFNWGLYDNYRPTHHRYWGIHTAMTGGIDDLIFPQREVAMKYVPESYREQVPTFTHPTAGGDGRFIGSPWWLS